MSVRIVRKKRGAHRQDGEIHFLTFMELRECDKLVIVENGNVVNASKS